MRRTKIIATIHQKIKKNVLREIINEGADIIRINSKYVPFNQYISLIQKIRSINKKTKIMIDIKERDLLKKIPKKNFDYIAISFAESSKEIIDAKKKFPRGTKIISKIETKKGVENINSLIKVSDGIMIARGDLGESITLEKLPMVQKSITKKCNRNKKMSIIATEMMLSMVNATRPSRAEVSDIANSILEGSEAVMLSEETAIGKHPILVIKMMVRVINETEKHIREFR